MANLRPHNWSGARLSRTTKAPEPHIGCWHCGSVANETRDNGERVRILRVTLAYNGVTLLPVRLCDACVAGQMPRDPDPLDVTAA